MKPRLLDIKAAAEYLSMSVGFVEKEIREGRLKQMHLGRVRRIDVLELDRYIEAQAVAETVGTARTDDCALGDTIAAKDLENMGGASW